MKMESMSKNIITIMQQLSKNNALVELLINTENSMPLLIDPTGLELKITDAIRRDLINPSSKDPKIHPTPFDSEATVKDGSFIRVYYNDGEFNENEVIAESQLHIDIICARSLWLINDGERSMIRPYEIMGRVVDMLGKRSVNSAIKLKFEGYQHLYINPKYDAIRLYCNYMSVET